MIEQAIYARLAAFSGLSALVGTRIYPLFAPERPVSPFVIYQRISAERTGSIYGPSNIAIPRFQIDAYATTYAGAKAVATQVRLALDNYRGTVSYTGGSTKIRCAVLANDLDLYEDSIQPDPLYRVSMDFMVYHDE